ncbi:hypothetical protein [Microbacterium sp. JAI119]|uniref:hypothetical protein n=1 Tax=Microbacterium sp. JAI119 TaxID=2723062 RepID=UPI0015CD10A6|nr:hypothetical protein [Microbacterium sp. JAI119]NYF28070.1 hypothetical protein [Microbacterium sp. JAI119]
MAQHNLSDDSTHTVAARYKIPRSSEDDERRKYQRFLFERHLVLALFSVMDKLYARGNYDHTIRDLYTIASRVAQAMTDGTVRGYHPVIAYLSIEHQQSLWEQITLPQLLRSMPPSWHEPVTVIIESSGLFALIEDGVPGVRDASYRWTYCCLQEYLAMLDELNFGLRDDGKVIDHLDDTELFISEAERLYGAKPSRQQR